MKTINYYIFRGVFLFGTTLLLQGCLSSRYSAGNIVPPAWAPPYDNVDKIHYYYLPDLAVYYDVWRKEYIYMQNGRWIFSSGLPPDYYNYDLRNTFVVLLDSRVDRPWRRNEFYQSHYPPDYKKQYANGNTRVVNENIRNRNSRTDRDYPQRNESTRQVNEQPRRQEQPRESSADRERTYGTGTESSGNSGERQENERPVRRIDQNNNTKSNPSSSGGRR